MNLIIATVCFIFAVLIGAWRQSCIFYRNFYVNAVGPIAWKYRSVRVISWLITSILSVIFAYIFANWVMNEINQVLGKFTFGVFLVTRLIVSLLIAIYTTEILDKIFGERSTIKINTIDTNLNDDDRVRDVINSFFNNSNESDFLFEMFCFRNNAEDAYDVFADGITNDLINLVRELKDEKEVEKKFFQYIKAYSEFSNNLIKLNGLPSMMSSSEEDVVKLAINAMQVLAKIYCLKKILIEYYKSDNLQKLDFEIGNMLK